MLLIRSGMSMKKFFGYHKGEVYPLVPKLYLLMSFFIVENNQFHLLKLSFITHTKFIWNGNLHEKTYKEDETYV